MEEVKAWYLSRTVWASAVTVILAVLGILKINVAEIAPDAITDTLLALATAVAGAVALFGRFKATKKVG